MSDRSALRAAVLAAPDDDLPRLVFADYLDETGDPADAARAAFLRLEVEADRWPLGSAEREPLEARAAVLLRKNVEAWNRELPGWLGREARVFYRRGFPFELEAEYERFAADAHELFDTAPIQAVQLVSLGRILDEFDWTTVRRPDFLRRVRRLGLSSYMSRHFGYRPPAAPSLCLVPPLTQLRVLDLGTAGVYDEWAFDFARAFERSRFAGTLEELLLADNGITDAGAQALAAAAGLDRLTRLDLSNNRLTPVGIGPLRARFGDRVRV